MVGEGDSGKDSLNLRQIERNSNIITLRIL
jgi:hypothetical protein